MDSRQEMNVGSASEAAREMICVFFEDWRRLSETWAEESAQDSGRHDAIENCIASKVTKRADRNLNDGNVLCLTHCKKESDCMVPGSVVRGNVFAFHRPQHRNRRETLGCLSSPRFREQHEPQFFRRRFQA